MQQKFKQDMARLMCSTVFAFFSSSNKTINFVMTNKMDLNERMSPVKHNHIIEGKFFAMVSDVNFILNNMCFFCC